VVVNSPGGNTDTVQVWDSPTTGANIIATIKPVYVDARCGNTYNYDLPFFNGLFVDTVGADWDITVIYE
jgi:hypothetical protein